MDDETIKTEQDDAQHVVHEAIGDVFRLFKDHTIKVAEDIKRAENHLSETSRRINSASRRRTPRRIV